MKQSKQMPILVGLVVVLTCAFIALGAYAVSMVLNKPLAEPMAVQIPDKQVVVPQVAAAEKQPAAETEKEKPAPKPVQKTETCGQSGVARVLFTGADFSMGNPPLGADAVRLVRVDYDAKKIVVVAFPRDLLLKTPGLAEQNVAESRLGLAYNTMKEATPGEAKHRITKSTELVAQTIFDNFGYPTEKKGYYYFTIQLDEVAGMINTIGGVEINLPEAITTERDVTFPAGVQTLDGKLSAEYLRAIEPGGDPARLQRQNLYMKALQTKILKAELLAKVPELYKQFDKAIVTDLSPKQLESLACMAKEVPQSDITFHEISGDLVTEQKDGALIPNVDKIKAALEAWLGE